MTDKQQALSSANPEKMEDRQFVGYVHNVSPVYSGKYFDFCLQGKDETVRTVCYSPKKRKLFSDYSNQKSPIKMQKFNIDTSSNTRDLICGDAVEVQEITDVDFAISDIPSTMNLAQAKTVRTGQHVTVKAKITKLGKVKKDRSGRFDMVEAVLIDPSTAIKVILWEKFAHSVEDGSTYTFNNLTVRKDRYTDEIYLNTAQSGTSIDAAEPFENILAINPVAPNEYLTSTMSGRILGVERVEKYMSCCKCNKKLQATNSPLAQCQNCHLKQKMSSATAHWYTHILFQDITQKKVTLTLFDTAIEESCAPEPVLQLNEDQIVDFLLSLPPTITVTFNNKSKVITTLAPQ